MNKKRFLSTFLAMLLCTACFVQLPIEADAASYKINTLPTSITIRANESITIDCVDELYCGYELTKGGVTVGSGSGFSRTISISGSKFSQSGTYRLRVYTQGYKYIVQGGSYKPVASGTKKYKSVTVTVQAAHTCVRDSGTITTQPTCTRTGLKVYSCTICGKSMGNTTLNATGHSYSYFTNYSAGEHRSSCTKCGQVTYQAHTWGSGRITVQPSCVAAGEMTYTCTKCTATKTETLPASGEHNYGAWVTVDENTHLHTCTACQNEETAEHTWNDGAVTKEATCVDVGEKTYTCTGCAATRTEEIAVLTEHKMQQTADEIAATCETAGKTAVMTCADCGKTEGGEEIPALGHNYQEDICATCGKKKYILGDANLNEKINLQDAILILQAANGRDVTVDSSASDVTGDGKITLQDAIWILRRVNGNTTPFPAEK